MKTLIVDCISCGEKTGSLTRTCRACVRSTRIKKGRKELRVRIKSKKSFKGWKNKTVERLKEKPRGSRFSSGTNYMVHNRLRKSNG